MVPLFFNTVVVSACAVTVLTCVTTFLVAVTVVIATVPPYAAVASESMTIGKSLFMVSSSKLGA